MSDSFSMTIEDVFSITGRGTVVTGRIATGELNVGDLLWCGEKETVCIGIEQFVTLTLPARTGANVGVLLRGLSKEDVVVGSTLETRCT